MGTPDAGLRRQDAARSARRGAGVGGVACCCGGCVGRHGRAAMGAGVGVGPAGPLDSVAPVGSGSGIMGVLAGATTAASGPHPKPPGAGACGAQCVRRVSASPCSSWCWAASWACWASSRAWTPARAAASTPDAPLGGSGSHVTSIGSTPASTVVAPPCSRGSGARRAWGTGAAPRGVKLTVVVVSENQKEGGSWDKSGSVSGPRTKAMSTALSGN